MPHGHPAAFGEGGGEFVIGPIHGIEGDHDTVDLELGRARAAMNPGQQGGATGHGDRGALGFDRAGRLGGQEQRRHGGIGRRRQPQSQGGGGGGGGAAEIGL